MADLESVVAGLYLVFQVGLIFNFGAALPRSAADLTLLSLNTQYASASPQRLADVARREQVDIITLQEVQNRQGEGAAYEARLRAAFPDGRWPGTASC